jgi:hypothetical protein
MCNRVLRHNITQRCFRHCIISESTSSLWARQKLKSQRVSVLSYRSCFWPRFLFAVITPFRFRGGGFVSSGWVTCSLSVYRSQDLDECYIQSEAEGRLQDQYLGSRTAPSDSEAEGTESVYRHLFSTSLPYYKQSWDVLFSTSHIFTSSF